MHLYGIFDLMRVMRKWGHPQLAVCPRFPWQNQMCVPDLHLLQTHKHTHTHTHTQDKITNNTERNMVQCKGK